MRMLREVPRRQMFCAGLAAMLLVEACGTARRRSGRLTYLLRGEPWGARERAPRFSPRTTWPWGGGPLLARAGRRAPDRRGRP